MSTLDKWSVFLQYAPDPRQRELVNKIIESEEVLTMAGELLMSISQDEREWAIFRSRRKFQTDMQSNLATAWDNGKAEGRAEIALNLMRMGFTLAQITEATGLSLEEVKRLRTEN